MELPVRGQDQQPQQPDLGLARWDPFDEFERLNQQLSSYLDAFRRLPGAFGQPFTPLADVEETDEAYMVEVELPGVSRDDLEIELSGRRVTVHGERKEKERVGILRRRTRTVGRFRYEVTLPGDVDEDGVTASLDDGVLTVRLPKPAHERPRRIQVN